MKIILYILLTGVFLLSFQSLKSAAPHEDLASINGFVRDSASEETLIGATVYITELKRGVYTNKSGFFSIVDIPEGTYTVKVSFMGYRSFNEKIEFDKGKTKRMNFLIPQIDVKTNEVSVEAEKEVEKRQISISKINVPIKQIKEIRIGGESDVFRAIQLLPGVLTSSQISSGLYIRGGSPDQNLVLLDGATVYNPSHLFGFISTFNADAIKDVELIKGGYPAEYGSRLSAVVNITQKDGNQNKIGGLVNLGLISSKASLEGPLFNGSWYIGGRRTYLDLIKPIIDTDPDNPIPDFGFYDVNAKVSQNVTKNDKAFISGFLSNDDFDFKTSGLDMSMYMGNRSGSLKWTHIFGDNLFGVANLNASYYYNGMKNNFNGYIIELKNTISDYTLKGHVEWFVSDNMTFKSGIEVTNYDFHYEQNWTGEDVQTVEGQNDDGQMNIRAQDWVYNAFAQLNYNIMEVLTFQTGFRVNYWDYSRRYTFDPRLAMKYQVHPNFAVKASWGIFHQYLRLAGFENFTLFDTWLPTDNTVPSSRADHYIISFETLPFKDIEFNFDVYYKDLQNISEMNMFQTAGKTVNDLFYTGNGKAYGAEVFIQKKIGRLAGWLGYGLGFVYAKFDSINHGEEFRPKYDRRHDFKVVLQYEISDHWEAGLSWMYQSGQSYTGSTSRFQAFLPDENFGHGKTIPSKRFGLRLPNSHQLNVTGSYKTTLFGLPFRLILDVFNVYNRKDVLMRYYDVNADDTTVEDVELLPIIPTLSVELKF